MVASRVTKSAASSMMMNDGPGFQQSSKLDVTFEQRSPGLVEEDLVVRGVHEGHAESH